MTDNYLTDAKQIYDNYLAKKVINSAYQDAVIAFLWLIARLMIEAHDRQTPSVVPAKKAK